jgi:glyoxylase-like metal-dependent hydrolase (beta-lactamase superfamily II)
MVKDAMGVTSEQIATGVWRVSGDIRGGMNVYFIEDGDGVVQFDAGTKPMTAGIAREGERLGGIKRIVLGHAHSDHRGSAPGLARKGIPVFCHPDEVSYAEADNGGMPDYWNMEDIELWWSRMLYPWLHRRWDGGPVEIEGTVSEGDSVAGFEVLHFPGHAPGLIGLWRESDRLALVSDTVYFIDSIRLKELPPGEATVPHPVFNQDTEQARTSLRRLASLNPAKVAAGHAEPFEGPGIVEALQAGAEK